ncbi:hypothetical protein IQ235_07110 [Oscillatoriales cyanobacterium LEGE 11467]|uniref:Uncharacterized protein n=1 Tax=Zarconia navalis LEGE 11467 TaxID=1828826 RepID=A0A928Z8H7_9CYAN|nr:hypothetical protein [Zarconia navalis]MBE9040554.1 hypothetical protein [Zarconia navalis LEGE 11467]
MTCVSTVSIVGLCISLGIAGLTGLHADNSTLSEFGVNGEQQWLLADAERDEGEPRRPGDGINR